MSFNQALGIVKASLSDVHSSPFVGYQGIIHDGEHVTKVVTKDDFICPRCGGGESFVCSDAINKVKWLTCSLKDCQKKNAKKTEMVISIPTLSQIGVPDEFKGATIAQIRQSDGITQAIRDFSTKGLGLIILAGKPGRGKTYAGCALLDNVLKSGESARYISYSDLIQQFNNIQHTGGNTLSLLQTLQQIPVLMIDDFGTRRPTEVFSDFIFFLIDKRKTSHQHRTIITTNQNSKTLDEWFGSALISRLASGISIKFEEQEDRRRINF